jgi:hypothetical protein
MDKGQVAINSDTFHFVPNASNLLEKTDWLLKHHRELIDADYSLNSDAGDFLTRNGKLISPVVSASGSGCAWAKSVGLNACKYPGEHDERILVVRIHVLNGLLRGRLRVMGWVSDSSIAPRVRRTRERLPSNGCIESELLGSRPTGTVVPFASDTALTSLGTDSLQSMISDPFCVVAPHANTFDQQAVTKSVQ